MTRQKLDAMLRDPSTVRHLAAVAEEDARQAPPPARDEAEPTNGAATGDPGEAVGGERADSAGSGGHAEAPRRRPGDERSSEERSDAAAMDEPKVVARGATAEEIAGERPRRLAAGDPRAPTVVGKQVDLGEASEEAGRLLGMQARAGELGGDAQEVIERGTAAFLHEQARKRAEAEARAARRAGVDSPRAARLTAEDSSSQTTPEPLASAGSFAAPAGPRTVGGGTARLPVPEEVRAHQVALAPTDAGLAARLAQKTPAGTLRGVNVPTEVAAAPLTRGPARDPSGPKKTLVGVGPEPDAAEHGASPPHDGVAPRAPADDAAPSRHDPDAADGRHDDVRTSSSPAAAAAGRAMGHPPPAAGAASRPVPMRRRGAVVALVVVGAAAGAYYFLSRPSPAPAPVDAAVTVGDEAPVTPPAPDPRPATPAPDPDPDPAPDPNPEIAPAPIPEAAPSPPPARPSALPPNPPPSAPAPTPQKPNPKAAPPPPSPPPAPAPKTPDPWDEVPK